jgi:exodeoxyribonuclease VII small subunit
MANEKAKPYKALREELDEIISKLQDDSIDLDEALELYEKANSLVAKVETYLKDTKHRFEVINKKSQ